MTNDYVHFFILSFSPASTMDAFEKLLRPPIRAVRGPGTRVRRQSVYLWDAPLRSRQRASEVLSLGDRERQGDRQSLATRLSHMDARCRPEPYLRSRSHEMANRLGCADDWVTPLIARDRVRQASPGSGSSDYGS